MYINQVPAGFGSGDYENVPRPAVPVGEVIPDVVIPMETNYIPYLSPNRGKPHQGLGKQSPLPSNHGCINCMAAETLVKMVPSTPHARVRQKLPDSCIQRCETSLRSEKNQCCGN